MPNRSFGSVKITYYDRGRVAEALRQALRDLVTRNPEVEEVVLFGSFIRGNAVPGSDVDLLLLLRDSSKDFLDRIPQYLPTAVPGGVDVFPYTRQELNRMVAEGNFFVQRAWKEGRHLTREAILADTLCL